MRARISGKSSKRPPAPKLPRMPKRPLTPPRRIPPKGR